MRKILMKLKEKKEAEAKAQAEAEAQSLKTSTQPKIVSTQSQVLGQTIETTPKNKWVLPVAIGGGVIILGVIIYLVIKKK